MDILSMQNNPEKLARNSKVIIYFDNFRYYTEETFENLADAIVFGIFWKAKVFVKDEATGMFNLYPQHETEFIGLTA